MQVLCKECARHLNISPSASIPTRCNARQGGAAERGRETLQLPAVQREGADSSNVVGRSVGRFALQYTQIISAVMI